MLQIKCTDQGYAGTLRGDLGIFHARTLFDNFKPVMDTPKSMTIDLLSVTRIDSSILQLLMIIREHLQQRGFTLSLTNHSACVIAAMETMGLSRWFNDPLLIIEKDAHLEATP